MSLSLARRAFPALPEDVADVLTTSLYTEFGSVSAKGVPLDTPLFAFVDPDGGTIDVATGLAHPAKANRVRRNPKVGLLLEGNGNPGEPVVSVAGFGAVRDSDIQANMERYLAETADRLPVTSSGLPWSTVRQAVWYWARIIVATTPSHIVWWPGVDQLDAEPQRWSAPTETTFPPSDPAPAGPPTPPSAWPRWVSAPVPHARCRPGGRRVHTRCSKRRTLEAPRSRIAVLLRQRNLCRSGDPDDRRCPLRRRASAARSTPHGRSGPALDTTA